MHHHNSSEKAGGKTRRTFCVEEGAKAAAELARAMRAAMYFMVSFCLRLEDTSTGQCSMEREVGADTATERDTDVLFAFVASKILGTQHTLAKGNTRDRTECKILQPVLNLL